MMPPYRIRVSDVSLPPNAKRYVDECLDAGDLSWHGSYLVEFERRFAAFCGVRHAVATCNGSAAVHLALLAAGVGPGDVVYVPAVTYIASVNAVMQCGADPVFCDIDPYTWCIDPQDVRRKAEQFAARGDGRRGVVMAVHLYGMPCDMTGLFQVAEEYGLMVVEDAAQSHGARARIGENWKRTGSLATVGAFSFFANKIMAMGEGGMVTTDNAGIAATAKHLREQCHVGEYYHDGIGFNYRLTNIQAALGVAAVEDYERIAFRRMLVWQAYEQYIPSAVIPQGAVTKTTERAHWLYSVLLPVGTDRDRVRQALAADGIETRPVFPPLTEMRPYRQETPLIAGAVAHRGLSLPTHANLTERDVQTVCTALRRAL